ncbi:MAG TPA: porin [Stellaceae bacterium]|nr:porin [Stellaceae bacterium]
MKKFLLGTTAVVAVGAFSGGAFAQSAGEPIKMGIGGYWRGAFGQVIDQSACNSGTNASCNKHHQAMQEDTLVDFNGSTKLDNGLTVGVHIQLRGEAAKTTSDTEKRSYVQFKGNFGEIRFGDQDDARLTMALQAPSAGSLFGVNSPFFSITGNPVGSNTTSLPIDEKRAQRIAYFSPTIAGFSLGLSYAPDSRKGNITGGTLPTDNDAGQNSQHWDVALGYDNKFGDFRLQAFAAASGTHQEAPRAAGAPLESPYAYDGGVQVAWGPFAVGGDYELVRNHRTTSAVAAGTGGGGLNDHVFDVGALYTVGPFSVSADWSRGLYKGFAGTAGGVCTFACSATASLNTEELIFNYVLGPGISLGAALQLDQYRSGVNPAVFGSTPTTNDYHSTVIEVGTAVTF